ncbi:alpha/beta hydrolase [Massilia sp.]|uniref:alpha/beta hydrolase n=1 Tax=Massilia sp. TaxID=1882437 RepID=UPI00352E765E
MRLISNKFLTALLFFTWVSSCYSAVNEGFNASAIDQAVAQTESLIDLPISQLDLVAINQLSPGQSASRFDGTTISSDGTTIAFTVYVPEISDGNSAPLLIQSHGWGSKRTKNLDTTSYEDAAEVSLQAAKLALVSGIQGGKGQTRGWYVISYDERGFGDSGGQSNIMDPEKEGQDLKAVIDWAEANLKKLAYRKNKVGVLDPVIGTVGSSYGGGFQTIGAAVDPRIDAITPTATWYDLRYSTLSHPKSEALALLTAAATAGGIVAPNYYSSMVAATTLNAVNSDFSEALYLHSPSAYCENNSPVMHVPQVPALVIQASSDFLFNLNEGFWNFECLRKSNSKSKFIGVRFGHPDVFRNPNLPKVTEENISCDGKSISLARLIFSFLSQNLIDSRLTAAYSADYLNVPDVVSVLDDGNSAMGSKGESVEGKCFVDDKLASGQNSVQVFKRGGTTFSANSVISGLVVGLPAVLSGVNTSSTDLSALSAIGIGYLGTPDSAKVVTLAPASNIGQSIFGVPKVQLRISSDTLLPSAEPPIVFIGLVRRTASGSQELIHNQVWPVRGYGDHDVDLPGVSFALHSSDQVGLAVFGFHPQYFNYYTRQPTAVNISNIQVQLPILTE